MEHALQVVMSEVTDGSGDTDGTQPTLVLLVRVRRAALLICFANECEEAGDRVSALFLLNSGPS